MPDAVDFRMLSESARKLYEHKDYQAAASKYEQAAALLRASGDLAGAAEMDNNRSVALAMAKDFRAAWEAAKGSETIFLEGGDSRRAGLACGNQAAALEGMGETRQALELYTKSADLLKTAGDSEARAFVLKALTALQARSGDPLSALASAQAAVNTGVKLSLREKMLKKLIDVPFRMLGKQ